MDKDIVDGNIGTVGKYDLEFKGGKLCLKINADVGYGAVTLDLDLNAEFILDALAKAIPGTIDDAILGVMKAALLGK
jgi:hypothetical protein